MPLYNTIRDLINAYVAGTLTLSQFVHQFTALLSDMKRGDDNEELTLEVQGLYGDFATSLIADEVKFQAELLKLVHVMAPKQ